MIYRVDRGGSWCSDPGYLRAVLRHGYGPDYHSSYRGFRIVETPECGARRALRGGSWDEFEKSLRSIRGGSWYSFPRLLRSANRVRGHKPVFGGRRTGFRIVERL